jgi:hypothetical protein
MKKVFILTLLLITNQLYAQMSLTDLPGLKIESLKINTRHSDIGPAIIDGKLYYSTPDYYKGLSDDQRKFFDLYSIPLFNAGKQGKKGNIELLLSTEFHDGSLSYCPETGELFLTRSDIEKTKIKKGLKKKAYVPLGIVVYQKKLDGWSYLGEFPYNSTDYSTGHPAINKTGDTLVFVSNQKGGYGKTDLYISVRKEGMWQEPQNLGKTINTRHNELTPFIGSDGRLIFASDGHRGKGGIDLYSSQLNPKPKSKPYHLGYPFNTRADDFGLTVHPNQMVGYLVSNRKNAKPNDDIFCVKAPDYDLQISSSPNDEKEFEQVANAVRNVVDSIETEMKNELFIPENVSCTVSFQTVNNDNIRDLKITWGYKLTTDTLKLGQNFYLMGDYNTEGSNAARVVLAVIKKSIDEPLKKYLTPYKRVEVAIQGISDFFAVAGNTLYNGEFGPYIEEDCLEGENLNPIAITQNSPIDNQKLAFLRSYGVRKYMTTEIEPLKHTQNCFLHTITRGDELNTENMWFTVEMTIKNVFGNY